MRELIKQILKESELDKERRMLEHFINTLKDRKKIYAESSELGYWKAEFEVELIDWNIHYDKDWLRFDINLNFKLIDGHIKYFDGRIDSLAKNITFIINVLFRRFVFELNDYYNIEFYNLNINVKP
jgi:hypothetical protein